ncbi:MAG TPA: M28 family peptidase [Bryobacteraceae bacterium]|nr:M28 family peptidase [Bryobacteraceae bacterium]
MKALSVPSRTVAAWLAAVALSLGGTASVDPQQYLDDVKYLASPELRGRGTGSPGLEKAAQFIAGRFRSFGLQPPGGQGHLQGFDVTTNARLGKDNRFAYVENGSRTTLKPREDFIPFNFSSRGKLEGRVVFAGYGITAPEYGYDDYAGLDVKDSIVLVLRHEPQEYDDRSVFSGRIYTEHAQFFSKAGNARRHGARGLILISDSANHRSEEDRLETFSNSVGPADAGIPFVHVKAAVAQKWFTAAGRNLEELQEQIDKDLTPRSFAFPAGLRVEAHVDLDRAVKRVHNVLAYLPGQTGEYVVIGAHYDHLGLGEQFSMAPSLAGTVHPGADDNASGTAGVIELARWFSTRPKPRRGILFMAYAGEELGLLGSSFYVNNPVLPLEKAVAMLNLDMIGRIREGKVFIGGVGTGTTFKALLDRCTPRYGLKTDDSEVGGYGSSDHTSFTTREIPVLFFFSGLHAEYHTPSDTWEKIEAVEAAKLLGLVSDVAQGLMESPERPVFVKTAPSKVAAPETGSAGGNATYFGSIPEISGSFAGLRFADVRQGSPAARAGLKAGDVLVEFDGKPIQTLSDFTYALQARKPGEVVPVKVKRSGRSVQTSVTLARRQ